MSEVFSFKNVLQGRPINPEQVPKLPPRAVQAIMERAAKAGVDLQSSDAKTAGLIMGMASELSYYTLRRLDHNLTLDQILDDEDAEQILAFYRVIQARNPKILSPKAEPASPAPATPTPS